MTSFETSSTDHQPSAFLDSSVLVSLFQFWDTCECANVQLDEVQNMDYLMQALEAAEVTTDALRATDTEAVKRGMKSFQSLSASVPHYLYFSSQVCWSQMHHVFLEARGLEHLIRQGVPHSLRMKRPQALYRGFLQEPDYTELEDRIETFRNTLKQDYQLDVINAEEPSAGLGITAGDIWESAQAIWSHILMGVIDAYACAATIRLGVDVFISQDSTLRNLFNHLRNPDEDWMATASSLENTFGIERGDWPIPLTPASALP